MNFATKLFALFLFASVLLLASCVYRSHKTPYPQEWESLVEAPENSCINISGFYEYHGEGTEANSRGYSSLWGSIFHVPDGADKASGSTQQLAELYRFSFLEIRHVDGGDITVYLWGTTREHESEIIVGYIRILDVGDYRCDERFVVTKFSYNKTDFMIPGAARYTHKSYLGKAGAYLVVKKTYSEMGVALVIPGGTTPEVNWFRYPPVAPEKLETLELLDRGGTRK
jgi:hypothetical protein